MKNINYNKINAHVGQATAAVRPRQKKIWILDEPLSNLDEETIDILAQTFQDHRSKEGSIIFSSHQNSEIGVSEEIRL